MSNYKIRTALARDFDRIFEIWLENQVIATGKSVERNMVEIFKKHLFHTFSLSNSHYYVAVSNSNKVVGWQSLTPLFSNPNLSPYIAQSSTYVDKDFLNNDVGQSLFEYAYKEAKQIGIDHIYGWVKPDNTPSHKIAANFKHHKCLIPGSSSGNIPEFNIYVIVVE